MVVLDFFISGLKFLETLGPIKVPIPALFRRYQYYDVYVCENCGRLEFFLAKDPVHT